MASSSSSSSTRQAYVHPTPSSAAPPPRPPLRRYFAPIFLLTTVVSLAFNRARLARDRSEEHRRHLVAYNILDDELRRLRRGQATSSRVTLDDADEERAFASRCARAGIDILRLGIRPEALPEGYMLQREKTSAATSSPGASAPAVTWGEALFGGQGTVERLKEAVGRAAMSVRASFAGGSREAQEGESEAVQQQQEDEWEKALLAYAASAEKAEEAERQRKQQQQQQQRQRLPEREQRRPPVESPSPSSSPAAAAAISSSQDQKTSKRFFV